MSRTATNAARSCADARRLGDAEDRAADHLESQRAHPLAQHDLLARPPAADLALGHVAGDLAERRDARALKRRQQQLALAQVLGPVEHEHGFGPSTGSRIEFASPARRSDWSPVNSSLIASGSAT